MSDMSFKELIAGLIVFWVILFIIFSVFIIFIGIFLSILKALGI